MSRGMTVNRSQLAEVFGISLPTVDAWIKRGCPYVKKANRTLRQPWEFDTASVADWLQEQALRSVSGGPDGDAEKVDIEEARRREAVAKAAMAELELQRKQGELVPVDLVEKAGEELFKAFKVKLEAIPNTLAPQLMACEDESEACELLRQEIGSALYELSELDSEDYEDLVDGGSPDAEADG